MATETKKTPTTKKTTTKAGPKVKYRSDFKSWEEYNKYTGKKA